MKNRPITVVRAGALRDAAGVNLRPGAIAVSAGRVQGVGRLEAMPAQPDRVIDLTDRLVMPAMVNAHAHFDLTEVGRRAYDGDFAAWLREVSLARPMDDADITRAVRLGARLSREAGVGCVGDIAYLPAAIRARQRSGLPGVSYLEVFGLGPRQADRIDQAESRLESLRFDAPAAGGVERSVVGLSPHSPYTAGEAVFDWAVRMSEEHAYRLCTHAAETPEELQFLRDGSGPVAEHLRHYGYTDADLAHAVSGQHPIIHLRDALRRGRWLLAHCNYMDDEHIRLLRHHRASVVYCPVASEYFGHPRGGDHRYRDMLAAGVNVCLGTDSIVCQPPDEPQPLGILAPMRRLHRRDGTAPDTLLAMATTRGMAALQWPDTEATLSPNAPAVFCSVTFDAADDTDPLAQVLRNDEPAQLCEVTLEP